MRYILAFLVFTLSTDSFACGRIDQHLSKYWRLDTNEKKTALLDQYGCSEPINYLPRLADPVISEVLADAINIGLPRKSIEKILENYNCAYGARKNEEYKVIRSYIGDDLYDDFCAVERLKRTYIVSVTGGAVLRSEPSTTSERIDAVKEGATVVTISKAEQWFKVKTYAGEGYMHKSLLTVY